MFRLLPLSALRWRIRVRLLLRTWGLTSLLCIMRQKQSEGLPIWVHLPLQLLLQVSVLQFVPIALTIGTRSHIQSLKKCLLARFLVAGLNRFNRQLVAALRTLVSPVMAAGLGESPLSLYPFMVRRAMFNREVSLVRSTRPRPWYRCNSLGNDTA